MKILEKKCPNCGANLDFKVGERDTVCKSCRRKYAVEYGVEDLSQLSDKAKEALKAADISLRPVRKVMAIFIIAFFAIVAIMVTIFTIQAINARNNFQKSVEQSQEEFERKSQEMIESVKR